MKKIFSFKYIKDNIRLIFLIIFSTALRLINLGYSDYQGDEIKALYLPSKGQSLIEFLIAQKKGPIQFLITYLLKFIDPSYENQFLIRLPFAIAGILSILFFYKFIKLHFGEKVAFYSSLFLSSNGLFIAFSRIIQYQSFSILFSILCLYFLSLSLKGDKYKFFGVFFGLIFWALSLLSHYDGFFIFPFVLYLLIKWFKRDDLEIKEKIRIFVISGLVSSGLLALFYIPFLSSVSVATSDYWLNRITGQSSGKISSSKYLFKLYQPIFSLKLYFVTSFLGAIFIILGFLSGTILKIKGIPKYVRDFFSHSTEIMHSIKSDKLRVAFLFSWVIITVLFFEYFVYISGTHIYNYLIPTSILMGFGLVAVESAVFKIFEYPLVRIFNFLFVYSIYSFLFVQSYVILVDHTKEYPWESKKFLIWNLQRPDESYHLSLFGFPYYRNWEGVRSFAKSHPELQAYSSNERRQISGYYLDYDRNYEKSGLYVYVSNPQSFIGSINDDKAAYWVGSHEPVYVFNSRGTDKVRVYMMQPGTLEEIQK